ncbi:hypothetical protein [Choristoneura rosaceana nucleopolyhedrovirus]|uniref:Uncharacterized protein n=1 Tax=Choristoneura rosaceana nucleopolyhedrovirus TaxID=58094 RepID=S5N3Z1_9ABAC|nr:hypothetical protein [Choristoneura rosaceana nucleopolyhedrovirus]AGR57070.1 hypothetical protein [Choristoneura rosaceana nucleopolyhedrovirus]
MRQRRPCFSITGVLVKRVLILDMRQRRPRFSTTGVLVKRVLIFNRYDSSSTPLFDYGRSRKASANF